MITQGTGVFGQGEYRAARINKVLWRNGLTTLGGFRRRPKIEHRVGLTDRAQPFHRFSPVNRSRFKQRVLPGITLLQNASAPQGQSLQILAEISELLARVTAREEIADHISERLRALLGAALAGVVELKIGSEATLIGASGLNEELSAQFRRFPLDRASPLREALDTSQPVYLEDIDDWQRRYEDPPATSFKGARVALPLINDREVLGGLTLTFAEPRSFSDLERELLMAIAHQCATALQRARLFEQYSQNTERLTRLQRVASALAAALTRTEVAAAITAQIQQSIQPEACGVLELTDDGRHLRMLHAEGVSERTRETYGLFSIDMPVPATAAIKTTSSVYVRSRNEWCSQYSEAAIVESERNAWATLPLVVEKRAIGVLTMSFAEPQAFDVEEREFFTAFANQCAVALERARLYEGEQEARARAEHANAAKSQFLGIMSHELRTPLNAVIGYADLLLMEIRGTLTDDQKLQVQRIRSSAWHQLGLIEEILAYARIEAGREEVRYAQVNASEILNETAALVRPETERKQLDLRVVIQEADVALNTDGAKLRQIMLNLAGNAAKFTTHGFVEIGMKQPSANEVVCYVQDSGPGIPQDKLELIWQPFTQVDQSDTRVVGGTGLGLAIARRLTQLLGGRLTVQSVLGMGSLFELKLPLH